jgi:tetratricopeptide (TPR) repeat protein
MLIPPLLAFAFWLEEGLRLDEGLDVLDTALRLNDGRECEEEVATHLQRARVLRLCGRFEDAKVSYSEAGRLATEVGDTHSVLLSRIGRAIVLQRLGNLPEAERVLREIVDDARLVHDRDAEARALHDLSATLYAAGRVKEAIPAVFRAYELYERPLHRARALSDTGTLLKELGLYVAAKTALSLVLSHELSREVRARAVLELLELSTVVGDRMSFERWRRDLADTREHLPVDDLVDYEMKLGAGLARFGNSTQGEKHAERAIAIAEKHRLGERLFRAEELLTQLRGRRTDDAAPAATAEEPVVRDPELQSTLDGLHTLAESR